MQCCYGNHLFTNISKHMSTRVRINMVILEIYSNCLKNKYRSRLFSKATVFVVILNVVSILIPFILAYNSRGFWLKHDTYYEQPDVKFKGEYIFIGKTNNISNPVICNNFPLYEQFKRLDTCDKIKVREIDYNYDDRVDELFVELYINLPKDISISEINFILPIDYQLHNECPMQMQAAIIVQYKLSSEMTVLDIRGTLELFQTYPILCLLRWKYAPYNFSIIQDETDVENYELENLIFKYFERNITTHLSKIYTSYITEDSNQLRIKLLVRYPEQMIYYTPGFWQVMKYAWIQYVAMYIIIAWVIQKCKNYIFQNNLVLFYKESPIKKKQ